MTSPWRSFVLVLVVLLLILISSSHFVDAQDVSPPDTSIPLASDPAMQSMASVPSSMPMTNSTPSDPGMTNSTPSDSGMTLPSTTMLMEIPPRGTRRSDAGSYVTCVVYVLIGLAYCFYGFYLFFPTLFISGFFLLSNAVYVALNASRPFTIGTSEGTTRFAYFGISAGAGIAGGLLLVCFWRVGVYLIGLLAGLVIGQAITSAIYIPWIGLRIALIIACGIACLVLVHFFERPVIIIGTALSGAYNIVLGVDVVLNWGLTYDEMLDPPRPGKESAIELAVVLVLTIIGSVWQFKRFQGSFGGHRRGNMARSNVIVVQQQPYGYPVKH